MKQLKRSLVAIGMVLVAVIALFLWSLPSQPPDLELVMWGSYGDTEGNRIGFDLSPRVKFAAPAAKRDPLLWLVPAERYFKVKVMIENITSGTPEYRITYNGFAGIDTLDPSSLIITIDGKEIASLPDAGIESAYHELIKRFIATHDIYRQLSNAQEQVVLSFYSDRQRLLDRITITGDTLAEFTENIQERLNASTLTLAKLADAN
jgi:hypothetical protein